MTDELLGSESMTLRLYAPMHADNWALALASGYLGSPLRVDAAPDAQSLARSGLIAFVGGVPQWALDYGDPGPRLVLDLGEAPPGRARDQIIHLDGFRRVSEVAGVIFQSADDMANFHASYAAFPDVPVALVPSRAEALPLLDQPGRPDGPLIGDRREASLSERQELDWFGGWAGGLRELARSGRFDAELAVHLATVPVGGRSVYSLAAALLRAIHPEAEALDEAIWGTVVEATAERRVDRGFDKSGVLDDVRKRLKRRIGPDEQAATGAWLDTCGKVVKAFTDPPSLDDRRRIGQRAALAVLLAPDARAAASLDQSLGAGPRVKGLAEVAARAFDGLARLDADWKSNRDQLDVLLDLGEGLGERAFELRFGPRTFTPGFEGTDEVLLDGRIFVERRLPPKPHELILRARAAEAGLDLRVDGGSGSLCFVPTGHPATVVLVEEDAESSSGEPIIRFVLPLPMPALKGPKGLQAYLEAAWRFGCAVGLRNGAPCAFAAQPTATLDRGEFNFHVSRLIAVRDALAPPARKPRARKPPQPA